jgi:chromosome segregation ATPase
MEQKMNRLKLLGIVLPLYCAFGATAEAKLYKWVDDKGETHYGEVVPPEYANKDKVQFNEKGREVKRKDAAGDAVQDKKRAEEEQAAIDRRRRDQALINTYSSEKEIDLARDRNLQQIVARINSVQTLLKTAQDNLDNYRKEAESAKKGGRKIHDSLHADIAEAEKKVEKLKQELAAAQDKESSIKASFEADKERYRELTAPPKSKR